ncbi:DUF1631 domain-containing protein [Permianibacter aggregans]|uniref:Uncharacterized protein DUF1631 n=1 Tax=Permianibacter aggregans TaxID=1510150 RepID=A0A4R6UEQ9_9GAMM|nr:DUF1631 domain-containing protein [Permianibacter aggregans]QGX39010.1 DUF1631 domain-containing protein [Permianibacter aggregans]TDQ44652.1 uncharacterized protein DUF1631 [Permianibacter aggregans]
MAFEPKVYNPNAIGDARRGQERKLPKLIERVRDQALDSINKLFGQMLDTADDTLFDLADKATNNKDQTMYFDAMRELRIKRKGMENVFRQELHNAFYELAGDTSPSRAEVSSPFSLDALSLVKEDELEENLAIDGMVNKAKQSHEEALRHLARRFDAVVPNCSVEPDDLPIYPKRICESFRSATSTLGLDLKARLVVYKLFERAVVSNLAEVYDDLNNFLADNGVLPDLHLRKPKARNTSQQPSRPARNRAEENSAPISESYDEPRDIKAEVFNALRDLLSVQKGGQTGAVLDGGFGAPVMPMVETPQLLNALSHLQHDPSAAGSSMGGQQVDLRAALASRLPVVVGRVDAKAIGSVNDDVIDIVSMMFDFILGDQNLPDEIKAPLGRLQIPLLKVALVDKTFFSNRNHAARLLLNEMAYAGIGWDPERRGRDGLQGKIEEIVQRVLSEFDQDVGLFTALLEEFRAYVEEERRRSAIIERRTKEAEEGKALSESAKSNVDRVLNRLTQNRQLPDVVSRMLSQVWSKVLFLEHVRSGPASVEYQDAVKVAETLVESVTIKSLSDRAKLPSMIPGLIRKLRAGFESISYGAIETTTMLQELESLHLHLMRAPIAPQMPVETVQDSGLQDAGLDDVVEAPVAKRAAANETDLLADELPETSEEDAALLAAFDIDPAVHDEGDLDEIVLASRPEHEQEMDGYLNQVDGLPIGSWIEMSETGKPQRCKLAARIPAVGKLIFVNRSGVKVAEYTRPGLAVALRRGSVRLLDDAALFDRALESVISNLRRLKEAADA